MNAPEGPYKDGNALWRAANDRARATASGGDVGVVMRRFVYDRFLARVFHGPGSPWVLKGGTAVLARVLDARTTKDVDLLAELDDLDGALERLRQAADVDLNDHFRFIVTGHEATVAGTWQPDVIGYRAHVDAYCGATRRHRFGVDLVTGSLMTTAPEECAPTPVLEVPGLAPARLRLYPLVDHIADKLCATQALYGEAGHPSSRVRDLIDMVVLARSQDIDGTALTRAVRGEWSHRHLTGRPFFAPPRHWDRIYPKEAATVPACRGLSAFEDATSFVAGFLAPVLDGAAAGKMWRHAVGAWHAHGAEATRER